MFSPAIDDSLFQSQLTQEIFMYFFKALITVVDGSNYEIWSKIALAGSRWVLAKTVGLIFDEKAHQAFMIHHLDGIWPRNKLHTSLESPE